MLQKVDYLRVCYHGKIITISGQLRKVATHGEVWIRSLVRGVSLVNSKFCTVGREMVTFKNHNLFKSFFIHHGLLTVFLSMR